MTPNEARREITNLNAALLRAGLAIDVNGPVILGLPHGSVVTWPSNRKYVFPPFASFEEYRSIVRGREYTALLSDGGVLQITLDFSEYDLAKHRLCYHPCPLILGDEEAKYDWPELFDLYLAEELNAQLELLNGTESIDSSRRLRLRSPMRFDYHLNAQNVDHPACHIHFVDNDVRWPVFGPLSIGHFVRFVFKYFYPIAWHEHPELQKWPLTAAARSITVEEEEILFIECRHRMIAREV